MCRGKRLVADFAAGTDARPGLPEELEEYLTTTVNGLWVVWAHKVARQAGELFLPLRGGPGYSGPIRLNLPVSCPVLPVCHDDAGWCMGSSTFEHSPPSLVLT